MWHLWFRERHWSGDRLVQLKWVGSKKHSDCCCQEQPSKPRNFSYASEFWRKRKTSNWQVGYSTEEAPSFIFPEIVGRPRQVWKAGCSDAVRLSFAASIVGGRFLPRCVVSWWFNPPKESTLGRKRASNRESLSRWVAKLHLVDLQSLPLGKWKP